MTKSIAALVGISVVVSACNNAADSNTTPKTNPTITTQTNGNTSGNPAAAGAQHLQVPKAGSALIASCQHRWKSITHILSSPKTTIDQTTQKFLEQLIAQSKVRICGDHFLYGTPTDSTKARHIDDHNASCTTSAGNFGDSAGKVFSLTVPCEAPVTGLQSIAIDSGFDTASGYSLYLRSTFYFDNLTAEEKAQTIKYLVPFFQKNTPSGYSAVEATADLK